jgi:hypothetical protein
MYNASYNDYELFYLIQEGSEQALNLLYYKYYIYINKIVSKYKIPKYKKEDLVQEGVYTFFETIKKYNPSKYNKTFFNYFKLVLERRFTRIINNSTYYSSNIILSDVILEPEVNGSSWIVNRYRESLNNELDKEIFDKCLINGMSLGALAKNKGCAYKKLYYRAKCICEQLKKY